MRPTEIANALKIGRRLEAGQQLTGASLIYSRDCGGQTLVDLSLDQIKLFLAILDRQKSHARGMGEKIANIEGSIPGDHAGFQSQAGKIVGEHRSHFPPARCRLCLLWTSNGFDVTSVDQPDAASSFSLDRPRAAR